MYCKFCGKKFNPESLNEVLKHEHIIGLSCDPEITGTATGKTYSKIESLNIAEISFCNKKLEFDIKYRNGKLYRYFDFPYELFKRALSTKSIGVFLSNEVKGNFRYACIN